MSQLGLWDAPAPTRTCEQCGSGYAPKTKRPSRFCSDACRYRAKDARGGVIQQCAWCGADYPNRSRGQSFGKRRHCSAQCAHLGSMQATSTPIPWQQCLTCNRWFVAHGTAKMCSDLCRHQRYLRNVKASNAKRYKPVVPFSCVECGTTFTPVAGEGYRRVYCSAACARRAEKRTERHHRRTAMSGTRERFTLLEIAVRDGWRCHLCHRKVSRKTWSLDHLIPVSQGGPHARANVALAHRDCNGRRGTVGPAQLLLLG